MSPLFLLFPTQRELEKALANQGLLVHFGYVDDVPANPLDEDSFSKVATVMALPHVAEKHNIPLDELEPGLFTLDADSGRWLLLVERKG